MPSQKQACFNCKVSRWMCSFPDYKEGPHNVNRTSVCYFCKIEKSIFDLNNTILSLKSELRHDKCKTSYADMVKKIDSMNGYIGQLKTQLEQNNNKINKNCLDTKMSDNSKIKKQNGNLNKSSTSNSLDNDFNNDCGYIKVKNGYRPTHITKFEMETDNPFKYLAVEENEDDTLLIGSSIIRHMDKEFVKRNRRKRRRICIPGCGINEVENELAKNTIDKNGLIITLVGGNETYKKETRNVELLNKYKALLTRMKQKTNNGVVVSILPRKREGLRMTSKTIFFNTKLEELCEQNNIKFVNIWNQFDDSNLFMQDGVHLNDVGNARLGRLLDTAVKDFYKSKDFLNLKKISAVTR